MVGIVLAGGENRRLPFNKCLQDINGKPIVSNTIDIFGKIFYETVISTNQPELYFRYGTPLIGDLLYERGPMTGIFSAMVGIEADRFFICACDMPFIKENLIRFMVSLDRQEDVVAPLFGGRPQPLFAIYKRRLIKRLYAKIIGRKKGMIRFLSEIDTYYLDERIVRKYDPEGSSFININTLEDARAIKGGK